MKVLWFGYMEEDVCNGDDLKLNPLKVLWFGYMEEVVCNDMILN